MKETAIYVGLSDSDALSQKHPTEKYLSVLRNVCRSYRTAFSVHIEQGGYFHEDGRYVEENTLVLTLADAPDETVSEIAKDLCAFFNQESVMITEREASVRFIHEDIV